MGGLNPEVALKYKGRYFPRKLIYFIIIFKTKNVLQDDTREYCAVIAAWLEDSKGCREIIFVKHSNRSVHKSPSVVKMQYFM